jgi:hypothetical protein
MLRFDVVEATVEAGDGVSSHPALVSSATFAQ